MEVNLVFTGIRRKGRRNRKGVRLKGLQGKKKGEDVYTHERNGSTIGQYT
jgi:hypothetical protein